MNICLIAHLKDLSGANLSLFDLAITYKSFGENVTVVLPADGLLRKKLMQSGIKTKIILSGTWAKYKNKKFVIKDIVKIVLNFFAEIYFYFYLKNNKFDILHFNSYIYGTGADAALKLGIPYVWHIREVPEKYMGLEFYCKKRSLNKVRMAEKVIAISNAVYNEMVSVIPADKLTMIYNGIQIEKEYRPRIFKDNIINVMIVGAITEIKNQMEAIRIINYVKQEDVKDIKLWVIGDIVDREYYKKLLVYIEENNLISNVIFTGFKTDLSEYRMLADFAIICTNFEGFGRVTVEAMKYGQIVFGADMGGTSELIKNGINGILYPLGKERLCGEKFISIIKEKKLCEKLSQNAHESADYFSIEKTAEKIIEQYKKVLS